MASDGLCTASLIRCTHVAVLCSLTEETRGLVDRRRMALMPKKGLDGTLCGAHLFNLARGGIVVEADVVSALATGDLSTYAADVFEQEPPPTNSPLLRCANFNGSINPLLRAAYLSLTTAPSPSPQVRGLQRHAARGRCHARGAGARGHADRDQCARSTLVQQR